MDASIAVLVPELGEAGRPEDRPLGRAALLAAREGIPVVFATETEAGRAHGMLARPGAWEPVRDVPVLAAYDRFPCQSQPERHARLLSGLPGLPVANPPSLVALCRDKLAAQRALEGHVRMPEVEGDALYFEARLRQWGVAFLKPRDGSFGRGIVRLMAGAPIPPSGEPRILQRAIAPPPGLAGACSRVLVQRATSGRWEAPAPVLRRSLTDPVVNAARGAEVVPLAEAVPTWQEIVALGIRTAEVLAEQPGGEDLAEVGVDLVLDPRGTPWVVEVNGRPRGRLEVLAARDPALWLSLHAETCLAPLRWLWARARAGQGAVNAHDGRGARHA